MFPVPASQMQKRNFYVPRENLDDMQFFIEPNIDWEILSNGQSISYMPDRIGTFPTMDCIVSMRYIGKRSATAAIRYWLDRSNLCFATLGSSPFRGNDFTFYCFFRDMANSLPETFQSVVFGEWAPGISGNPWWQIQMENNSSTLSDGITDFRVFEYSDSLGITQSTIPVPENRWTDFAGNDKHSLIINYTASDGAFEILMNGTLIGTISTGHYNSDWIGDRYVGFFGRGNSTIPDAYYDGWSPDTYCMGLTNRKLTDVEIQGMLNWWDNLRTVMRLNN